MEQHCTTLIVGGGIGGLAAALGVSQNGKNVWVLEQAPEFGEIGAGLQLAPNGLAALDFFGVLDKVYEHAVFPKRLVLKDARSGDELGALDLGEAFQARYQYPYIVTHRSDLHSALLEACRAKPNINLCTNKKVIRIEHLADEVKVTCEDGSTYRAEAVIGADGLWSMTRKLLSDDKPVCSEYVAYRGTIPMSEMNIDIQEDDVVMYIGPHMHFVQYPVRRKELFNQVAVFKSFKYKDNSDDWGTPDELDECFSQCAPHVRHAAGYMNRGRRWPMYDRDPIDNWSKGRITLLGDAAHPMLQYMAQGACQALEDAAYLAAQMKKESDIEKVFQAYQMERIPRTARVQRSVRLWGEFLHTDNTVTSNLRARVLSSRKSDDFEDVDWIYGYRGWLD
jgi:salicylate hydroxylase